MDSAAGNMKDRRDPKTQGILPVQGKLLNSISKDLSEIVQSREIKNILLTLGCGVGSQINLRNLRYNKIIIATDADSDGSHITLLLNTLFLFHLRPLLEQGHIYRAVTPLYAITQGKNTKYFFSEQEWSKYTKEHGFKGEVERFKGLGSLSKDQTETVLLNAETRILQKITIPDVEAALEQFNILMGKKIAERKALLLEEQGEYYERDE